MKNYIVIFGVCLEEWQPPSELSTCPVIQTAVVRDQVAGSSGILRR